MKNQLTAPINIAIMENEVSAMDWQLNELAHELYWWSQFFNIVFFKNQPVPVPAISFERTNVQTLGHYVPGRNAFGLLENININRAHLNRPLWDILATLVHEMAHAWQKIYGKPSENWFHNKQFQVKMDEIGIQVNPKGMHMDIKDPFVFLLKKHGVEFKHKTSDGKIIEIPPKPKIKGKSKLKKWTCGCTNIRVAVKDLQAICLKCENIFEPA